jgi:YbbR domain-containing protein
MKHELFKNLNSYVPLFIRRNFARKVIAIFFAILLYMKVSTQLDEERVMQRIPVNIVARGDIDIMNYLPDTVDMTVRGSKQKVKLLTPSDIRIEIPVDNQVLKQYNYQLNKSFSMILGTQDISMPPGISLIRIIPNEVTIHCDKRISKEVPVIPSFRGSPPVDYERGELEVIPKTVSLTGPETILKDINTIPAETIYLDKTTVENFMVDRKVLSVDKKILVSPTSVQIKVEIYKSMGTSVFDDVPVCVLLGKQNAKLGFMPKLLSNTVNITLRGPNSQLELLTKNQIKAFVDVSDFNKPGIYQPKVDCWINDPRINVKFIEPTMLNVELLQISPVKN